MCQFVDGLVIIFGNCGCSVNAVPICSVVGVGVGIQIASSTCNMLNSKRCLNFPSHKWLNVMCDQNHPTIISVLLYAYVFC